MPVIGSDNALIKMAVEYTRAAVLAYNVYWYRSSVDPDAVNITDVAQRLATNVLSDVANLQSSGWSCGNIIADVVNSDLAPLVVASGVGAGAVTGEANMPVYSSFPIRLHRTLKDTRSGYKRIPGVTEEMVDGNNFASSVVTAWQAIEDIFSDSYDDAGSNTWSPVIVRTQTAGVPIENPEEYVYNPISSSEFIDRVTTQNSRKPWS